VHESFDNGRNPSGGLRSPAPLEKHDARRDADVQGRNAARHGNPQPEIAVLRYVLVQSTAFAAKHECDRFGKRDLIVQMFAALVNPVNPVAVLLQVFERPADVHDADHRNIRQRAGGGAPDRFRQPGRAALRNHDSGGSGGVRRADNRAQIVRVLDAVKDHVHAARARRVRERRILSGGAVRDHTLVRRAPRRPVQLLARFETNRYVTLPAQIEQFLKTRPRGSFDHENPVERAAGPQGFPDGMDSYERGHYDKGTLMSVPENAAVQAQQEIPDKLYFRIGEVARLAGIKPYVLRFWETEFSALGPKKSGTGHRLYRRKDVELVLEIKRLLYDQRFTIEGARKYLEARGKMEPAHAAKSEKPAKAQRDLFGAASPLLETVRKELREIVDMLK